MLSTLSTLEAHQLLIIAVVAISVGMAKTGIGGMGMIAVPLLAWIFGGRASTGVMLPFLIAADIFAIYYFHRFAQWSTLARLLPMAIIGIMVGTLFGQLINDEAFKLAMAIIIIGCVILMIWQEKQTQHWRPDSALAVSVIGILGGITTMVGNLAGPVMAIYLLSLKLPKNEFIGTAAWFFFLVNVIKVPFHILGWQTITIETIAVNFAFLPFVALGAWLGMRLVQYFQEQQYRYFVIAMTLVAAITMLF